jgi:hypothetical protein
MLNYLLGQKEVGLWPWQLPTPAILCSNQDGKIQVQYRLQFKISKAIASRFTFCISHSNDRRSQKIKKKH